MPSQVGALNLPTSSATTGLRDPTLDGILDYCGFWIRNELNPSLERAGGRTRDAAPVANRFPWDPKTQVRRDAFPGLYAWWDGKSKLEPHTLVKWMRTRKVCLAYLFEEVAAPTGFTLLSGLLAAVDAALCKASDRQSHESYGYNGDAAGTPLWQSLNLISLSYDGATMALVGDSVQDGARKIGARKATATAGSVIRGFPTLTGSWSVGEIVGLDSVDTFAGDLAVTLETGDAVADTVAFRSGYLVAPDGSEVDDNG